MNLIKLMLSFITLSLSMSTIANTQILSDAQLKAMTDQMFKFLGKENQSQNNNFREVISLVGEHIKGNKDIPDISTHISSICKLFNNVNADLFLKAAHELCDASCHKQKTKHDHTCYLKDFIKRQKPKNLLQAFGQGIDWLMPSYKKAEILASFYRGLCATNDNLTAQVQSLHTLIAIRIIKPLGTKNEHIQGILTSALKERIRNIVNQDDFLSTVLLMHHCLDDLHAYVGKINPDYSDERTIKETILTIIHQCLLITLEHSFVLVKKMLADAESIARQIEAAEMQGVRDMLSGNANVAAQNEFDILEKMQRELVAEKLKTISADEEAKKVHEKLNQQKKENKQLTKQYHMLDGASKSDQFHMQAQERSLNGQRVVLASKEVELNDAKAKLAVKEQTLQNILQYLAQTGVTLPQNVFQPQPIPKSSAASAGISPARQASVNSKK